MIEKLINVAAKELVSFADLKKDELEKLSNDQLAELIHECENIKPNYPASVRMAGTVLKEAAKVIQCERK